MTKEEARPIFTRASAARSEGRVALRSCWNCNGAHEHLRRTADWVINCFECGHFYFEGTDLTALMEQHPEWEDEEG